MENVTVESLPVKPPEPETYPVDGDLVAALREMARGYGTPRVGRDVFDAIANMMERNYVRREDCEDAAALCARYAEDIAALEAERDEWKAKAQEEKENAEAHWRNANKFAEERDEWRAKCETACEEYQLAREERDAWMRRYEEVVNSRNEVVSSRNGGPAPESGAAAGQVDSDGGDAAQGNGTSCTSPLPGGGE